MKVFGIAGWSGSGKTTLLLRLIPYFRQLGLKVATVKHTHHNPEVGDEVTRALVQSGASQVITASESRFALYCEVHGEEPEIDTLIHRFKDMDLLLIEGFKHATHPKLEVYDPALGKPLLCNDQAEIVALASAVPQNVDLVQFGRDDIEQIAQFVLRYLEIDLSN